ncbi:hypothetical protein OA92_12200 [Marinomonas sp. SBI22]|uniref:Lnb N-terminal periplasmic domain-containing protein n=1 Tax=unclassified Marinomonas TaxID=196814 RepID=UPI0007AF1C20|nr:MULTISPECIES: DUF4105 domain-containing protein [unclassified Marinomonas]KZM41999.1 hypothetical protein OA92_12200 [Marinomonas sp. SBI22]KZM47158.1 hypothetical protein OA91_01205 [Marinomonas sp. SBI8L]
MVRSALLRLRLAQAVFLSLFVFSHSVSANESEARSLSLQKNDLRQKLIQIALDQNLSQAPRWHKLLHYKPDWQKGHESIVDDESFFISNLGKYRPELELVANVELFLSEQEADKDTACHFPARNRFLYEALTPRLSEQDKALLAEIGFDGKSSYCQEYLVWRNENPVEQAWLIFPTAFLNSPSSMFGHTLLRLDLKGKSTLLSKSITYAAHAEDDHYGAMYAIKGLFGGHPGYFSILYYHKKVKEYTRTNNRDIWEYQLNLNEDETDWIMAHLWELQEVRFDYYFSTQNCSYQLLAVLDVARPEQDLTAEFDYLAIPVDTIRALEKREWIEKKQFRPSENRLFYTYLQHLSQAEKDLVFDLQENKYESLAEQIKLLPRDRQRLVLEAAYKLITLRGKDAKNKKKRLGLPLLRARSKLGKSSDELQVTQLVAPEKGHLSQKLSLGFVNTSEQNKGVLDLKLTLHSLDDPVYGFDKGSQINFLQQKSVFDENDIKLESFDLLNIRSLTPSDKYLTHTAWQVSTGLERHLMPDDSRRLNKQVVAGFGRSWRFNQLDMYALFGGQLEGSNEFQDYLEFAPKVDVGLLLQNDVYTSELHASQYRFLNAKFSRMKLRWTGSWTWQQNQSISVNAEREEILGKTHFSQFSLQYNHFF